MSDVLARLKRVQEDLARMRQQLQAVRSLADAAGAPTVLRLELARLGWRAEEMAEVVGGEEASR